MPWLKEAAAQGWINEKDITEEILYSIKRAGADMIVTYFAKSAAKISSRIMRDDERFEIQRAFDLLPHVIGCSWASIWFRMNEIKRPTREEFREKTIEYFKMTEPVFEAYPKEEKFLDQFKNTLNLE